VTVTPESVTETIVTVVGAVSSEESYNTPDDIEDAVEPPELTAVTIAP
jgi:hypothetical protein